MDIELVDWQYIAILTYCPSTNWKGHDHTVCGPEEQPHCKIIHEH